VSRSEHTLESWLAIATKKLSPAALERVTLEIQSHFEDATASHQTEGVSETEAKARALEDLGNAKAAARRFRQSHLTKSEARRLENTLTLYDTFRGLTGTTHFFGSYCSFIAIKILMPTSNTHPPGGKLGANLLGSFPGGLLADAPAGIPHTPASARARRFRLVLRHVAAPLVSWLDRVGRLGWGDNIGLGDRAVVR
jgi:hypothetical protein